MSSREEFEAWIDRKGLRRTCSGDDQAQGIHLYWLIWQAAQESQSLLFEALLKIQFRCDCFLEDERDMNRHSIEAIKSICDKALGCASVGA